MIFELIERRKILKDSLEKVNASQVRDREQLSQQIEMIDEALERLYTGKYSSPLQYELLKTLFFYYLKEDRRKDNVGRAKFKSVGVELIDDRQLRETKEEDGLINNF
ncbi:hypothetical protein [Paenibacillus senegalensis]|uniref:hypothetical protein n=1 Tax=Paenibacillus senegalensis TaxID=1465766 RepID=UPI0016521847|nr:hypothetical protein [Paenibacillus senegalensis]